MLLKEFFHSRLFTVSNFLSLLRIFLSPFVWVVVSLSEKNSEYTSWVLILVVVIVLTDFFDGFIARKFGQVTPLGQYLDPIADKVAVINALFIIYVYRDFPLWAVLFISIRELLGIYGGGFLLVKRNVLGQPNYWGKVGVCCIAIVWLMYFFNYEYRQSALVLSIIILISGIVMYIKTYWYTIVRKKIQ